MMIKIYDNTGSNIVAIINTTSLHNANLCGMDLHLAGLAKIDLSRSKLSNTNLDMANLTQADLSAADLRGANLSGANLSGANLKDAILSGAHLSGAVLDGACLDGADLTGAILIEASMQRVSLLSTVMLVAEVPNIVSLGEVKIIDGEWHYPDHYGKENKSSLQYLRYFDRNDGAETLRDAIYDSSTIWPVGFNPEKHGAIIAKISIG